MCVCSKANRCVCSVFNNGPSIIESHFSSPHPPLDMLCSSSGGLRDVCAELRRIRKCGEEGKE